jgi:hypothetical protein
VSLTGLPGVGKVERDYYVDGEAVRYILAAGTPR